MLRFGLVGFAENLAGPTEYMRLPRVNLFFSSKAGYGKDSGGLTGKSLILGGKQEGLRVHSYVVIQSYNTQTYSPPNIPARNRGDGQVTRSSTYFSLGIIGARSI